MTDPCKNTGRVQWLTFFGVEHVEAGEGGVYRLHRLSIDRFEKMSKQSNRRLILITTHKLKKEEIYNV